MMTGFYHCLLWPGNACKISRHKASSARRPSACKMHFLTKLLNLVKYPYSLSSIPLLFVVNFGVVIVVVVVVTTDIIV